MSRLSLALPALLAGCPRPPEPDPCAEVWVRWENFAQPQVQTWCAPCHAASLTTSADRFGAPIGVDFDTLAGTQAWADRFAARVGDGTMPPAGGLSDEERELLTAWAECGAPGVDPDPDLEDPCDPPVIADAAAPCAAGGNTVAGDLVVEAALDVSCVCRVDGDLVVRADTELPLLRSVGGALRIEGAEVRSVAAPAVSDVAGAVQIVDCPTLTSVRLPWLHTAGGIEVAQNPALAELFLDRVDVVGQDYRVVANPALVDWRGMQSPRTVGGSIWVVDNDAIGFLDGFGRVESLGGDVRIVDNDGTAVLFGFQKLVTVPGAVEIADHDRVKVVETLVDVVTVGGTLTVAGNVDLEELSGFAFLASVGGDGLVIRDNPKLVSVVPFVALTDAAGIRLATNRDLLGIDAAFPVLTTLGVAGLAVEGNEALRGIVGFDQLQAAQGPIRLVGNPLMNTFSLPALASAPTVEVSGADLAEIAGLPALVDVEGDFIVADNPALVDVTGLHGLERVGGTLVVRDNPALPQAAIDAWIAEIGEIGATEQSGNGARVPAARVR